MKGSSRKQLKSVPTSLRFGQRIPLNVTVRLSVAGQPLGRGTIRNASISGALIETPLDLPPHTNLTVTLTIQDGNAPSTRELSACLVRIDPAGFGVEWRDIGSVDVMDLIARASNTDVVD